MSYLTGLEPHIRALLQKGDAEEVIAFVKEKAGESYKNGLRAGQAPAAKGRGDREARPRRAQGRN